jgi:thymidylate synthase (FAD)
MNNNTDIRIKHGIKYIKPSALVLQHSSLFVGEIAGRTAYDSFDKSEHQEIKDFDRTKTLDTDIEHSEILDSLAWVYHHHSVLEHISLTYFIRNTSRSCLQELARHRIASYTVRSTRYTMSSVINAYVASQGLDRDFFIQKIIDLDLLVLKDKALITEEAESMFNKLLIQQSKIDNFIDLSLSKSTVELFKKHEKTATAQELYEILESGKKKRNVGDAFKHIVTDNWKVELVMTFNLRSLKNFIDLRANNAAYFQIRWLAEEIVKATPKKFTNLIVKQDKIDKICNK